MSRRCQTLSVLVFLAAWWAGPRAAGEEVLLADGGSTGYVLYSGPAPAETTAFAAAELAGYFTRITGAKLPAATRRPDGNVIAVGIAAARELGVDPAESSAHEEGFVKVIAEGRVVLAGNTPRATLYAVYDFLEDLGCRWLAPNFDYPAMTPGEFVPRRTSLAIAAQRSVEAPSFRYRYKRVEEGHSHTPERLVQLIDWMAKVKLNAFNCPIDYNNLGRSAWDRWRAELTPELKKRGILIDVGGHGYETFLRPEVYAEDHPEWYGTLNGRRMSDMKRVNFNTANREAVSTLIENIGKFLRERPEIEIFSLVPPDTPHWDESAESKRLGPIPVRHALLVNQVSAALKDEFPNLRIVIPAYQALVRPPEGVRFEGNLLLGFAAIRRDNARPMSDPSVSENAYYMNYVWQWLDSKAFAGDVLVNGYYYRYAWRSLPVVGFRVMAQDLRFLQANGVAGGGSYSEPGNWFTYELTHYLLARLLWNHGAATEALLADFCRHRFESAAEPMQEFFGLLDGISAQIVRGFGNYSNFDNPMPFPELGVERIIMQPLAAYRRQIGLCERLLRDATGSGDLSAEARSRIENWSLLLRYLRLELEAKYFGEILSSGSPFGPVLQRLQQTYTQMAELIGGNSSSGLFLTEDPRINYRPKTQPRR